MRCPALHDLPDGARFCPHCGVALPLPMAHRDVLTDDTVDPVALYSFIGTVLVGWFPAAFLLTLVGSFVALRRTRSRTVRGRGLAIAALVIHGFYLLAYIALVAFIILAFASDGA